MIVRSYDVLPGFIIYLCSAIACTNLQNVSAALTETFLRLRTYSTLFAIP